MAISLQVASAVRVTVRGTAYLPSPLLIAEGTAQAAEFAEAAAQSATAASEAATAAAEAAAALTFPIAADDGGTGLTSYAVGDLLYASGATTLAKLADVAAGNVLKSGGVGVAPAYGKVTLTADVAGTLPVANGGTGVATATAYALIAGGTTGAGALQSIASVGTSGQVLKSNGAGALPTFQNEAGAFVLIQTQTASASAAVDFISGLNDTSYDSFLIRLDSVKAATDDVGLVMRVGTGGGPTYQTSGYHYVLDRVRAGSATPAITQSTTGTYLTLTETGGTTGLGNAAGEKFTGEIVFADPESSDFCEFSYRGQYGLALGESGSVVGGGRYNTAGAITAIRFLMTSGNIASGRFSLYGLKKS